MALTQIKTNAIADDAVTTDKLDDAINTARDANTAKTTNATHSGDVTGSGSLTIADNTVTLAKMAGGTDGQIITYDASGDPVAVGPGTDGQVLTSTGAGSPPAFENIPAGVGGAIGVDFNNSVKARFGTDNDIEIFHDGNHSYINHTGTGDFYIQTNSSGEKLQLWSMDDIYLKPQAGENGVIIVGNGSTELYYDNSQKLNTDSWGVAITGELTTTGHINIPNDTGKFMVGASNDVTINHNGSDSYFTSKTGDLYIQGNNSGTLVNNIRLVGASGIIELYNNNVKIFETQSNGITVKGPEGDAANIALYADEGDDNADCWTLVASESGPFYLQNKASGSTETSVKCNGDGNVELYFDNSKKLETTSTGLAVSGNMTWGDGLGPVIGAGNDLQLYHDNSTNYSYIANLTGFLEFRSADYTWKSSDGSEIYMKALGGGDVELYHANEKKLYTEGWGITVIDSTAPTTWIGLNTSGGVCGYLVGQSNAGSGSEKGVAIYSAGGGDKHLQAINDGSVELYYDNVVKGYTYSEGWKINGYMKALASTSDSGVGDNTGNYHHIQQDSESDSTIYLEHSGDSTPRGIYAHFSDAAPNNTTQYFFYCEDSSGSVKAKICANGDLQNANNSYGSTSDIKLKENIVDANSQWNDIKALKVRNFNFKTDPDTKLLGVVAQEVEPISPGLVDEHEDLELGGASKGTTTKTVKYSILYMKAIKALQEAIARIETLETEVAALKG